MTAPANPDVIKEIFMRKDQDYGRNYNRNDGEQQRSSSSFQDYGNRGYQDERENRRTGGNRDFNEDRWASDQRNYRNDDRNNRPDWNRSAQNGDRIENEWGSRQDYDDEWNSRNANRGSSGAEPGRSKVGKNALEGNDDASYENQGHDANYMHWRQEQLKKLDEDYNAFQTEKRQKFSEEFSKWRTEQQGKQSSQNGSENKNASETKKNDG